MRTTLLICLSLVMMLFVVTGCYEVIYSVEIKGSCIKFEDAQYDQDPTEEEDLVDACLGDDEVVQTDILAVQVDSAVAEVLVSLKAGKDKATDIPVPTDGTETAVGAFLVSIEEIDEEPDPDPEVFTYIIGVTSDDIPGGGRDGTAALSNITICFGDAEILAPEEGEPFYTGRDTELEEPGEPVEEEEEEID